MSKIICDICGTSYPETAKQCPICGCVRPGDVQRVTNEIKTEGSSAAGYTYVKGGRFSKSNVKKRGKANGTKAPTRSSNANNNDKEPQSNRGMVIAAILLLLGIIGVVIYIAVGFFGPISGTDKEATTPSGTVSQLDLSCRGITTNTDIVIIKPGEALLFDYKLQPAGTTDKVAVRSENPDIATVLDKGGSLNIAAVAEGTAKIVITCGEAEKILTVYCQFEQDPSAPSAPTTPSDPSNPSGPSDPTTPSAPKATIRLNRQDMSLFRKGDSWDLYSGDAPKNLVKFSSDNEAVVTFKDGIVTAVSGSSEYVWVHAEYEGQKVSCKVLCQFKESGGTTGNGGVTPDEGGTNITGTIINVQEFVNVRSGPGTTYDLAGKLNLGEKVTITEKAFDSSNMEWGKTAAGWVRMDFIKIDSN